MIRLVIRIGIVVLAAGLVGPASPEGGQQIDINIQKIYSEPSSVNGVHNVALYLGNKKTVKPPPTDPQGRTTLTLPDLPENGLVADVIYCKDGSLVMVEQGVPIPDECQGGFLIATIPLTREVTEITVGEDGGTFDVVVEKHTEAKAEFWTNDGGAIVRFNHTYHQDGQTSELPGYNYAPDPYRPGTFEVWKTNPDGSVWTYGGVAPEDVGLPWGQFELNYPHDHSVVVYEPQEPMADPGAGDQPDVPQDGTTDSSATSPPSPRGSIGTPPEQEDPAPAPTPTATPRATPPGTKLAPLGMGSTWAGLRAGSVTRYGLTALLSLPGGPFTSLFGNLLYSAIPQATPQQRKISYSLVANGNSSGEAFSLQVSDPSGRVNTIHLPQGTVLEPTGQRLKNPTPPAANSAGPNHSVSSYCLQFHKQPPAPGMLFRIAGPDKQEANEPAREVLAAIDRLYAAGKLHPDIEIPQYLDAIRQYAVWSKQENWDQKAFTESWIERTKKNAQNLNVKWNKQMEKTLNQAAPGRWSDISTALAMASEAERIRMRILSNTPPGRTQKP